ncbi:hypothetical protein FSP39_013396 [Pinctada imbricata]|uniref:G-protein coupled receptors family 1 profile domain-containing protein n=1 Tax=Pinctada imbricata TaxID=66713 RepID=A0AA88Y4C3_PINIB|nr:hypothetical protein FSP39_013396 [Pinctada imbricata]
MKEANTLHSTRYQNSDGVTESFLPPNFHFDLTTLDYNISDDFANASKLFTIPNELRFNDDNLLAVISYTCMFVVAACGNLTVFITLFRNRHVKSRVNQFILHLSIADLIVTFIMLPLEIIWNITVEWTAGDAACRTLMFFRILGLYLSSFILVAISLDRYFAIVHPLSLNDADKRGKIMLILAWTLSIVASVPQVCKVLMKGRKEMK